MTTPATPRPPPPTATAPPLPRRSSTCDGSSCAPERNLMSRLLQVSYGERGDGGRDDEDEVGDRPREERGARLTGAPERAEREHELGEAGGVDRQPVQRVLVERVERERPPREARDVLQALRVDRMADLAEQPGGEAGAEHHERSNPVRDRREEDRAREC